MHGNTAKNKKRNDPKQWHPGSPAGDLIKKKTQKQPRSKLFCTQNYKYIINNANEATLFK